MPRVKKLPPPAPDITYAQTESWLAIHLIIDGCAKLEACPAVNQAQALAWARERCSELGPVWDHIQAWLED